MQLQRLPLIVELIVLSRVTLATMIFVVMAYGSYALMLVQAIVCITP
jgi:hypothetical protein